MSSNKKWELIIAFNELRWLVANFDIIDEKDSPSGLYHRILKTVLPNGEIPNFIYENDRYGNNLGQRLSDVQLAANKRKWIKYSVM